MVKTRHQSAVSVAPVNRDESVVYCVCLLWCLGIHAGHSAAQLAQPACRVWVKVTWASPQTPVRSLRLRIGLHPLREVSPWPL